AEVRGRAVAILGRMDDPEARGACKTALSDADGDVRWRAVLSSLQSGVSAMQLPRAVSHRPRVRKSPRVAAMLNLILPGMGYTYLGKWWGFMLWQTIILGSLVLFLFVGGINTNYSVLSAVYLYPLYVGLSIHSYFMAKRMPEM
ncbi:MAG TPA: HEAT repeat domain-containing protein, partial [Methanomicrobiales archaeon]|nr:HEAT repeat domain-containing protein [Methanomicrobiales archaeon]